MPYQPHVMVRCNGTIGSPANPAEIFSYGVSMAANTLPEAPTEVDAIVAACVAYHGRAGTAINSLARLTEVAISLVQPDGVYADGRPKQKQAGDTIRRAVVQGGAAPNSTVHPYQVAYRVSLDDGVRGVGHRGGWYVPFPGWQLDGGTGLVENTVAAAARDSAKTWLAALTAARGAPPVPGKSAVIIASGKNGNLFVSRLRVGRVLDTIRSRRNDLAEDYQVTAIP